MATIALIAGAAVVGLGAASALGLFDSGGGGPKNSHRHIRNQGKRLDDLRVQGSQYGAPIPVSFGTLRLAGQMIWAKQIEEREITRTETSTVTVSGGGGKSKGKGGGGKKGGGSSGTQTTTTTWTEYEYYGHFATAFSAGPADDVLRIWADGNLIFDKTGESEITHKLDLVFRFYPGDETQEPDALITGSVEGGQAPAHRGLVYIVFEDLPLKQFGMRIPSITAEIAFIEADNKPWKSSAFLDPTKTSTNSGYKTVPIVAPDVGLVAATGNGGIHVFDFVTTDEIRFIGPEQLSGAAPDGTDLSPIDPVILARGQGGVAYGLVNGAGNDNHAVQFDLMAGRVRNVGPLTSNLCGGCCVYVVDSRGAMTEYFVGEHLLGDAVTVYDRDTFTIQATVDPGEFRNPYAATAIPGGQFQGQSEFYWGARSLLGSDGAINRGIITSDGSVSAKQYILLGERFLKDTLGEDVEAEGGAAHALIYDRVDGGLIFHVSNSTTGYWVKYTDADGVVWIKEGNYPNGTSITYNNLARGEFVSNFSSSAGWVEVRSTATGDVVETSTGWPMDAFNWGIAGHVVMDGESNTVWTVDNGAPHKVYLYRGAGAASPLGAAVTTICSRIGLAPEDIDVSELDDEIPGFSTADPDLNAKDVLAKLAQAYRFDAVESDYLIRFRSLRTVAPAVTLYGTPVYSDLVWIQEKDGLFFRETRKQEVEMPQVVSVTHFDPDRDYLRGEQHAQRPLYPTLSAQSENRVQVDLPMAITAQQALDAAWHILREAWIGRVEFSWRTTWAWLALDPLDVVQVYVGSDARYLVRLARCNFGSGMTIDMEGNAAIPPSYQTIIPDGTEEGDLPPDFVDSPPEEFAPQQVADGGSGYLPSEDRGRLSDPGPSRLFLIDSPLWHDSHSVPDASRLYYGVAPYNPHRPWGGATVGFTRDAETWQQAGASNTAVGYGSILNTVGAPEDPWRTDTVTTITVRMLNRASELEGISDIALVNGANAAALVDPDGVVELIQYRDVAENADGTFTLSTLLRGRRGTEWACGGHVPGTLLMLLSSAWFAGGTMVYDDIGVELAWVSLTDGGSLLGAFPEAHTHHGRDLMPYAPVHLTAEISGSDIVLSWVRRTRIGGAWRDGTGDVPLAETTEAYEIDVIGPDGVVASTLTSTTPSVTYAGAALQSDLHPRVFLDNLTISDPGAELNNGSWTATVGAFGRTNTGERSGLWAFWGGNTAETRYHQDIAIPAAHEAAVDAGAYVDVRWWQSSQYGEDAAGVNVMFYDGSATVLGTDTGEQRVVTSWTEFSRLITIPTGTRTIRIEQHYTRNAGSYSNALIDDMTASLSEAIEFPTTATFRVYQMSSTVGRGFPATLEWEAL